MTSMTFFGRGDGANANNAALNVDSTKKVPTAELRFESTAGGDIILDYHNGNPDPDTVVFVDGVERQFFVEFSGTLPDTKKMKKVNGEDLRGEEIVVITTDDGQRYFFLTNGTTSFATMNDFPNGAHDIQNYQTNTNVYVCFCAGTRIRTPTGDVPVETLKIGDLIQTASGEAVPIQWLSKRHVSAAEQLFRPDSRPVCIPRDALGRNRPNRDLWLSPQHRVLICNWQAELLFGDAEVFVHAKHLPAGVTGAPDPTFKPFDYHHILLENHRVVVSNGLETESLFPGDVATASLDDDARASMLSVLSRLETAHGTFGATARPSLRQWESRILLNATHAPAQQVLERMCA